MVSVYALSGELDLALPKKYMNTENNGS